MGDVHTLPTRLRVVPMAPAGAYGFSPPEPIEPTPSFRVDRRAGCVTWEANGLQLVHAPQFRALADLFAENGWIRHFNALGDAELALSEPEGAA